MCQLETVLPSSHALAGSHGGLPPPTSLCLEDRQSSWLCLCTAQVQGLVHDDLLWGLLLRAEQRELSWCGQS